jgi:hypothetical protein
VRSAGGTRAVLTVVPCLGTFVPGLDLMAGSISGETKLDVSSYASDHQQLRGFGLTSEEPHPALKATVRRRLADSLPELRNRVIAPLPIASVLPHGTNRSLLLMLSTRRRAMCESWQTERARLAPQKGSRGSPPRDPSERSPPTTASNGQRRTGRTPSATRSSHACVSAKAVRRRSPARGARTTEPCRPRAERRASGDCQRAPRCAERAETGHFGASQLHPRGLGWGRGEGAARNRTAIPGERDPPPVREAGGECGRCTPRAALSSRGTHSRGWWG